MLTTNILVHVKEPEGRHLAVIQGKFVASTVTVKLLLEEIDFSIPCINQPVFEKVNLFIPWIGRFLAKSTKFFP